MSNRHSLFPAVLALLFSASVFSSCTDDTLAEMESTTKEKSISFVSRQNISRADTPLSMEDYSDCFYKENLNSLNGLFIHVRNNNPKLGDQAFLDFEKFFPSLARVMSGLREGSAFQIWVDKENDDLYSFRLYSPWTCKYLRTSKKAPVQLVGVYPYPVEASQQWFLMPKFNGYARIGSKAYGYINAEGRWRPYVMDAPGYGVDFLKEHPTTPYQEFQLIPRDRIPVTNVEFDFRHAIIKELPQDKHIEETFMYLNQKPYAVEKTVGETFKVNETSNFDVNHDCIVYQLAITETSPEIELPTVLNDLQLTIKDDEHPAKHKIGAFQKTYRVEKEITYGKTYEIPPYTKCVLKARFKTFSVQVPVTVHLNYIDENKNPRHFMTRGIWKGTVVADPALYDPIESIEWSKLPRK